MWVWVCVYCLNVSTRRVFRSEGVRGCGLHVSKKRWNAILSQAVFFFVWYCAVLWCVVCGMCRYLEPRAGRFMAIAKSTAVVMKLTNVPDGLVSLRVPVHPKDPSLGMRPFFLANELYIEQVCGPARALLAASVWNKVCAFVCVCCVRTWSLLMCRC